MSTLQFLPARRSDCRLAKHLIPRVLPLCTPVFCSLHPYFPLHITATEAFCLIWQCFHSLNFYLLHLKVHKIPTLVDNIFIRECFNKNNRDFTIVEKILQTSTRNCFKTSTWLGWFLFKRHSANLLLSFLVIYLFLCHLLPCHSFAICPTAKTNEWPLIIRWYSPFSCLQKSWFLLEHIPLWGGT